MYELGNFCQIAVRHAANLNLKGNQFFLLASGPPVVSFEIQLSVGGVDTISRHNRHNQLTFVYTQFTF